MSATLPHDHGNTELELQMAEHKSSPEFLHVTRLCSILSDPTRLRIFWILCHSEECVINLSALMEMSSPAVSHHLSKLRAAGLAESRREGKEVYYRAARTEEARLLHELIESVTSLKCPECGD